MTFFLGRVVPVTMIASLLAGCAASTEFSPFQSSNQQQRDQTAQLAAFAATANLPDDANFRSDLPIGAVINRETGAIQVFNFSDRPVQAGSIWINRNYVRQFDTIPARGHVTLSRTDFYNREGQSLATVNTPVQLLQLQTENQTYSVLGPVHR